MSEPDIVERVRMGVAEAGYDPGLIGSPNSGGVIHASYALPDKVVWRAMEAVRAEPEPRCFRCALRRRNELRMGINRVCACLATRRFTEDCGVDP